MVEQRTVTAWDVGSSPTFPATKVIGSVMPRDYRERTSTINLATRPKIEV